MSVLIKGMEKPKSCTWRDGRCPLLCDDDCKLQDCQEEWTWQDQYKGCPLSDVPDICVGDMKSCIYCHEDSDGYVTPIEKNCHAFIRFGMNGCELSLKAKGWHGSAKIKYCPMCGRELKT